MAFIFRLTLRWRFFGGFSGCSAFSFLSSDDGAGIGRPIVFIEDPLCGKPIPHLQDHWAGDVPACEAGRLVRGLRLTRTLSENYWKRSTGWTLRWAGNGLDSQCSSIIAYSLPLRDEMLLTSQTPGPCSLGTRSVKPLSTAKKRELVESHKFLKDKKAQTASTFSFFLRAAVGAFCVPDRLQDAVN